MKATVITPARRTVGTRFASFARVNSRSLLVVLAALPLTRSLAAVFTQVMDEEITPRQTVCIVNALLALLLTVFPFAFPIILRVLCVVWLFAALRRCKAEGLGDDV